MPAVPLVGGGDALWQPVAAADVAAAAAATFSTARSAAAAVAAAAHGSGLLTEAELGAYLALCPGAAVVSHESQQSACRTAAAKSD